MPVHTAQPKAPTVTVLGLGPMGRALAGAFLDAGLRTTVWNRTPGRDGELAARGAVGAGSAEEAVAASALTVVCVVNYDASDAVLRTPAVAGALKGRTVVNLTADTPDRARSTAAWAAEHGVEYLDGAIMTPTPTIGTPDGVFLYSGPADLYRAHRPVLDALNGAHTHLGEEIGRAATYDIALLDLFWTSIAGYTHALALARAEGVGAVELTPFAQGIAAILPALFEEGAKEVDSGRHSGEGNPLTSALSTMTHVVQVSESHGIDASVMRSAEGFVRRAIAQGHGSDGFTRLTEVLGRR
ncbi:NAD(P)-dependent oxidoreductase [Streptomyces griseiscabiei]|uniref:NAD(P)-binding domain-containing protein n=1 Tax=Streptomyces griseiscabiei TaxID=2993540 RepID=A0ABU4KWB6_9ACTN|nr:NAD(P)-binding domain-containing protein [Streptomyces griseiscabiei]MBZ3903416.1 NAD(P)-dependent oxidoreductase [Streptomyces griseiscabiei]MDX2907729.1 NAD(P)-binding domain-containing protein [Streptomyces griseiscabiei]